MRLGGAGGGEASMELGAMLARGLLEGTFFRQCSPPQAGPDSGRGSVVFFRTAALS